MTKETMSNDSSKYPHKDIGHRISALRETTGMTKRAYAGFCGFEYTQYINWELGYRRPLPDDAIILCEKSGATLDFIYRGIEAQLPQSLLIALSSSSLDRATKKSKYKPD